MPTIRELEDLIIDAIYLDILRGKLDQKEEQLEVEYTMGRDLEPEKLEDVLAALKDWYGHLLRSVWITIHVTIQGRDDLGSTRNPRRKDQHDCLRDSCDQTPPTRARESTSGEPQGGTR